MARLDQYLIRAGFLPAREAASEEIKAGKVMVNDKVCIKPGYQVKDTDQVRYLGEGRRYVSRGAQKMLGALEAFHPILEGSRCLDVGASTGGFTQVMLEQGAAYVAAIDVGHGQLDPILQQDPRVKEYSGLNFRSIPPELTEELRDFDFATMDVSFISVCLLAEPLHQALRGSGQAILLIKPQFEAGRGAHNKAGVVKDPQKHEEVLQKVLDCCEACGFELLGLTHSPLKGPEGNIEYLLYIEKHNDPARPSKTDRFPLGSIVTEAFRALDQPEDRLRGTHE